jgi:hypothetical protein
MPAGLTYACHLNKCAQLALQEPPLARFEPAPRCDFDSGPPLHARGATLNGSLFRVTTCELLYGPFNCAFAWKSDNR